MTQRTHFERFRIQQIAPASPGWYAVYYNATDGAPMFDPVIAWAFGHEVTVNGSSLAECRGECAECGPDSFGTTRAILTDGPALIEAEERQLVGFAKPGDTVDDWKAACLEEWEFSKRLTHAGSGA